MNNPVLMQFEKSKNKSITVKVTLFLGDGGKEDEYVQGILKSVDYENQTITVEQHFPFYNLINKDTTETLLREFKIGQFLVVGNLKV